MNIEKIKLTEINEARYNPRFINDDDMSKLKNSLSTFGLVDPIIINLKTNTIIGGHQRYNALIELGQEDDVLFDKDYNLIRLGDVGWVFDDNNLSIENDDYEKALNLALNKISGEWDNDKLKNLLDELKISDIDVSITGFDNEEINDLISEDDIEDLSDLFNDYAEVYYEPKETFHKIDDLYDMPIIYDDYINKLDNNDLKELLNIRKYQFCKFNFRKIADYYAYQANAEEQEIMEKLALVILDREKLIKNGFTNILDNYKIDEDLLSVDKNE